MAYGLRIRVEYKDHNDVLTRINIYQENYTGTADVRTAHSAFKIEWGDQGSNDTPLIYGSSCTIYFDSEADYEFLYLFNSDSRKHLVSIEKAGVIFWVGFIEPDSWSEPLIATPYPIECTAYDMLGFLKDIAFVDDDDNAYTGKKTMFEILQTCLLKTGLALTINTAIDWEEELQEAGTDLLKVHTLNCDNFIGKSCYAVIEQVLHECRIMQRNGQWWIISNSFLAKSEISYFSTTSGGVTTSGTFDPTETSYWVDGEMDMEVLPAIKQLTVVNELGLKANLIENGSFKTFDNETGFDGWENIGCTPIQGSLNANGDRFVYIPGKQYPDTFANKGYGLISNGIKKTISVKETDTQINFSLKYAEMGSAYSSLMFIRIRLVGSSNTYYLRRARYIEQTEVAWEWVDTITHEAVAPIGLYHDIPVGTGDDYICLKSHLAKSAYNGETLAHPYYNTFDNVTAYPANSITDHFETFKAAIPGLPESGTLEIYLYVPYSDRPQITGSCYTGVNFEMLDENAEKYPEKRSYKIINSAKNNYVPDDVTTLVGDYSAISNSDSLYVCGISRLDNSHTTGWRVKGQSTYYTFVELIARMMASAQRTPRQNYNANLADVIPRLNLVIEDPNNPDHRFYENGITYDDDYQTIEGRFTEILSIDFTGQTLKIATEFNDSTLTTVSTANVANPANIEERVTIVDLKSATISNPGNLNSEYFDSVTSEEDGITRINIREDKILEIVNENLENNVTNIYQSISQIIRTEKDGNHESFIIENTINNTEMVISSWSVLPYNQQVGEFKAVVMVRNKVTNAIITLISLLSFDYSDAIPAIVQNDLLTNAVLALTVGTNGSKMLYATVTGMTADAKRIHFCYERCVLSEREWLIDGEMDFNLGMSAALMSIVNMGTLPNDFSLAMAATLSAYGNALAEFNFGLGMSAELTEYEQPVYANSIYGLDYNFWAATDARNIAPEGWHVPTIYELQTLDAYVGSNGGKLKETGYVHWNSPNAGATNEVGFYGRGAGERSNGVFVDFKDWCYLKSISEVGNGFIYMAAFRTDSTSTYFYDIWTLPSCGHSIRLIKNDSFDNGTMVGTDGLIYRTVKIGNQVWMAENYKTRVYRNGDPISYHGAGADFYTNYEWHNLTTEGCCPPNGNWNNV